VGVTDNILATAVDAADLDEDFVHMLLYGRNGIGKTTFACQFPKPLLLIALEMSRNGGAESVRKIPGVKVMRPPYDMQKGKLGSTRYILKEPISQWLERISDSLHADEKFQSVVIDSGTVLDQYILAEVCHWGTTAVMNKFGKVSGDQYTERSEKMRLVLQPFIELQKHVIIVCNEKDHNPSMDKEDKEAQTRIRRVAVETMEVQMGSFFGASMGQGTAKWAQDACRWTCQLHMRAEIKTVQETIKAGPRRGQLSKARNVETGENVRALRLKYHPNFMARGRVGLDLEIGENIPEFVFGEKPSEMYAEFMRVERGEYSSAG
jgi:hypothetical protein